MADVQKSQHSKVEISDLLTEFVISAEVTNAYTLDDFREFFPPNNRDHNDVKLLYKAFQLKRKKLRATVKRNIAVYCANRRSYNSSRKTQTQTTSESAATTELTKRSEEQCLKEKLSSVNKDLRDVESQFLRCAKLFKEKDLFRNLNEKDFGLFTIKFLQDKFAKSNVMTGETT